VPCYYSGIMLKCFWLAIIPIIIMLSIIESSLAGEEVYCEPECRCASIGS